jgi:hypothetical protein
MTSEGLRGLRNPGNKGITGLAKNDLPGTFSQVVYLLRS